MKCLEGATCPAGASRMVFDDHAKMAMAIASLDAQLTELVASASATQANLEKSMYTPSSAW